MRTCLALLAALSVVACNSSKAAERAPVAGPTADDVGFFVDGWLINVAAKREDAKKMLAPSATIDVEGCGRGVQCLDEIAQLASVCMGSIEDGIHIDGARVDVHLSGEDFVIGTIDLELHKQGEDLVIDAVRAHQKKGWTEPADEDAIAFVKTWLATMSKKKPAADAGLGDAVVNVGPMCETDKPCVGERLHEIMATRPALDVTVLDRAKLDKYNDEGGKLATLERVSYVYVEVSGNVQRAGMESAEITVAVGMGPDASMMVKGIEVDSGYASTDEAD